MRVVGIDPGTTKIGYGVIDDAAGMLRAVAWGILAIPQSGSAVSRLRALGKGIIKLIKDFAPEYAGVETLYFTKNQRTAMGVAQARGVILYLLSEYGVPAIELGPGEIKRAITNYGAADKRAVAHMVARMLRLRPLAKTHDDASDALAAAIATANRIKGGYACGEKMN